MNHQIVPERNPTTLRIEFAVYVGGVHYGYVSSYLAGQAWGDEILAARAKVR